MVEIFQGGYFPQNLSHVFQPQILFVGTFFIECNVSISSPGQSYPLQSGKVIFGPITSGKAPGKYLRT